MRPKAHMFKWVVIIALLSAPAATWAFYKPARVLTPELNGALCVSPRICVDNEGRLEEAHALYRDAFQFVETSLGRFQTEPRVIFCSTDACAHAFGLGKRAAVIVGRLGIVVSPRAWKSHYLRHEMIHHAQYERLGIFKTWLNTPKWFVEGMAYHLSDDPRPRLAEPFESQRAQFAAWYDDVEKEKLWLEAEKL